MELMPRCIHGGRVSVFVLPHFAQQNFSNPAAGGGYFSLAPLALTPTLGTGSSRIRIIAPASVTLEKIQTS